MSWIEKNQKPLLAVGAILGIAWFGGRYFDESESYSAEKVKIDWEAVAKEEWESGYPHDEDLLSYQNKQANKSLLTCLNSYLKVAKDEVTMGHYDYPDLAEYTITPEYEKAYGREPTYAEIDKALPKVIKGLRKQARTGRYRGADWEELSKALKSPHSRYTWGQAYEGSYQSKGRKGWFTDDDYYEPLNAETFHAENESYVCLKNGKTYRKKKRMASHRLMGWLDESPPLPAGHGCYNCGSKKCIGLEELPYRTFFWPKKKRSSNRYYGAETYAADFIECKDESCDTGHCPTCGNCWDGIEVSCSKCGDDWGEYSKLLDRELYGAETFEADSEYHRTNYHGDLPYDVMKDAYEQARKEKRKPVIRNGKRVSVLNRADWEYYELDDETIDSGYITVYYKDPSDPYTLYEIIFDFDTSDVTPHEYGFWEYFNFNFDPVNPKGYANYTIGYGEDEGKILSSHRFTSMNAETFDAMSFKQWSDDEMHEPKHGGSQMQFDDWLEEEIDSHGDIPLSKWGYEEEHDEKEHQHSESFDAEIWEYDFINQQIETGDIGDEMNHRVVGKNINRKDGELIVELHNDRLKMKGMGAETFNAEYPKYREYKGIFIEKTAKNRAKLASDMWDMTAKLYKPRKKGNWILQLTQTHPQYGDRYKTEVKNFTDGLNLYLKLSDLSKYGAETFHAEKKKCNGCGVSLESDGYERVKKFPYQGKLYCMSCYVQEKTGMWAETFNAEHPDTGEILSCPHCEKEIDWLKTKASITAHCPHCSNQIGADDGHHMNDIGSKWGTHDDELYQIETKIEQERDRKGFGLSAETFENLNPNCIYMTNPKEASWVGFPLIEGKGQTDCYDLGYDMCESCGDFYGYKAETFNADVDTETKNYWNDNVKHSWEQWGFERYQNDRLNRSMKSCVKDWLADNPNELAYMVQDNHEINEESMDGDYDVPSPQMMKKEVAYLKSVLLKVADEMDKNGEWHKHSHKVNFDAETFEAEYFTSGQKNDLIWFYLAYEAYATNEPIGSIYPDEWEKVALNEGHWYDVDSTGYDLFLSRRTLKSLLKKGLVEATHTNYIPGDARIRKTDAQRLNENPDLVSWLESVKIKLTSRGAELIEKMYARKELGAETFEAKGDCKECYGTGGLYDSHMGINDECHFCGGTGFEY